MNARLVLFLTWKSLAFHRVIALITVAGVAIGMSVMATVLVVDHNTARSESHARRIAETRALEGRDHGLAPPIERITVYRRDETPRASLVPVPTQRGGASGVESPDEPAAQRLGEEDYQAMRLAVRLASLLAFAIGAVVVLYTMRFSASSRSREFALVRCLGAQRTEVAQALVVEAAILGALGTGIGTLAAIPAGWGLLRLGITTTGRSLVFGFTVPWLELALFSAVGLAVALFGVLTPVRGLLRLEIRDVLQPRFLADDVRADALATRGFIWIFPPLALAAYLVARPFLQAWLSVVVFFLLESLIVVAFATALLWWVGPLLRGLIAACERLLRGLYPLESLLTSRHMRLTRDRLVFSVVAVTLVFGMLVALHSVTASLKQEIESWAQRALYPYEFADRRGRAPIDEAAIRALEADDLAVFRLSGRTSGAFPLRLIHGGDLNRYRAARGRAPLEPSDVIFSTTLANRFGVEPGDRLEIVADGQPHAFRILEIDDAFGFFPERDQYVNLRSYALFHDASPLFAENLGRTLGNFVAVRRPDGVQRALTPVQREALFPRRPKTIQGASKSRSQKREIDRDFLIFDYVLVMTVLLASIGIVNAMLIQVRSRAREFALFRVVGMSASQVARLLVLEGAITGLVGGGLALVLGSVLGRISVSFLDRFTLFDLEYATSPLTLGLVFVGAVAICCVAAIYPALRATRISSAESLHYE